MNNAGISRAHVPGRSFDQAAATDPLTVASLDEVRTVFETNVFGVIAVTQAMLPLLREASVGRIVNIGSSAGSLTLNSDPAHPRPWMFGTYSATKAASHAITVAFAAELESAGIKVNAACPGFTSTDLNDFRGTRTVEEAAHEPVRLAILDADGPTGMLSSEDGPVPSHGDVVAFTRRAFGIHRPGGRGVERSSPPYRFLDELIETPRLSLKPLNHPQPKMTLNNQ